MATPSPTLDEQIEELERELKLRERHYPRWVKQGKTTQRAAEQQLARLRAARDTLLGLRR